MAIKYGSKLVYFISLRVPIYVIFNTSDQIHTSDQVPIAQMVVRPLREREVVGSTPGRAIPKTLKWYQWLPCFAFSIKRQALALLSLTTNTTNIAQKLKKRKKKKLTPALGSPGLRDGSLQNQFLPGRFLRDFSLKISIGTVRSKIVGRFAPKQIYGSIHPLS